MTEGTCMRRRAAIIATAAAAALGGGLLLAPTAQAEEEACNGLAYDLDVVVNGEALIDEAGCLSPDGGGAPELPPLEPPALP
jgi:hypothetical protein